jgi:ATP adenylyltransferase
MRLVPGHQLCGVSPVSGAADQPRRDSPHGILWAPWRLDYVVRADDEDGCFLCNALASDADAANFLVERRESCFSILNRYPYNNGHLLVATGAHKGGLADLDDQELAELMRLTRDSQQLLQRAMAPDGFNIGINLGRCAGAGLPGHLHVHVVPRWSGDTNFMAVTAKTKVIVQSLESLYQMLREQLEGVE